MSRNRLVGLSVFVVLLAAACGGETPSTGGLLGGKTIKIAFGSPTSGSGAVYGVPALQGLQLAVDLRNKSGGILGAKVEISNVDTEGRPELGASFAKSNCDDSSVLAVAGYTNSGVTIAATEVTHRCGLPVVAGEGTNPKVTDRDLKDVFRISGRDDVIGPAVA